MATESKPNEPSIEQEKKHAVDIMIPPACMDDEGECEHSRKSDKVQYNPV